jgi:hypothetical protein
MLANRIRTSSTFDTLNGSKRAVQRGLVIPHGLKENVQALPSIEGIQKVVLQPINHTIPNQEGAHCLIKSILLYKGLLVALLLKGPAHGVHVLCQAGSNSSLLLHSCCLIGSANQLERDPSCKAQNITAPMLCCLSPSLHVPAAEHIGMATRHAVRPVCAGLQDQLTVCNDARLLLLPWYVLANVLQARKPAWRYMPI